MGDHAQMPTEDDVRRFINVVLPPGSGVKEEAKPAGCPG
jgi:hypothetical protein